eukprot:s530_g26.t1
MRLVPNISCDFCGFALQLTLVQPQSIPNPCPLIFLRFHVSNRHGFSRQESAHYRGCAHASTTPRLRELPPVVGEVEGRAYGNSNQREDAPGAC